MFNFRIISTFHTMLLVTLFNCKRKSLGMWCIRVVLENNRSSFCIRAYALWNKMEFLFLIFYTIFCFIYSRFGLLEIHILLLKFKMDILVNLTRMKPFRREILPYIKVNLHIIIFVCFDLNFSNLTYLSGNQTSTICIDMINYQQHNINVYGSGTTTITPKRVFHARN